MTDEAQRGFTMMNTIIPNTKDYQTKSLAYHSANWQIEAYKNLKLHDGDKRLNQSQKIQVNEGYL